MMKVRIQTVMSEPSKILVGKYTTKSGQVKNRYRSNPNAKPINTVVHRYEEADKSDRTNVKSK